MHASSVTTDSKKLEWTRSAPLGILFLLVLCLSHTWRFGTVDILICPSEKRKLLCFLNLNAAAIVIGLISGLSLPFADVLRSVILPSQERKHSEYSLASPAYFIDLRNMTKYAPSLLCVWWPSQAL